MGAWVLALFSDSLLVMYLDRSVVNETEIHLELVSEIKKKFGKKAAKTVESGASGKFGFVRASNLGTTTAEESTERGHKKTFSAILHLSLDQQPFNNRIREFWWIVPSLESCPCPACGSQLDGGESKVDDDSWLVSLTHSGEQFPSHQFVSSEKSLPRWAIQSLKMASVSERDTFAKTVDLVPQDEIIPPLPVVSSEHNFARAKQATLELMTQRFVCENVLEFVINTFPDSKVRAVCDFNFLKRMIVSDKNPIAKGMSIKRIILADNAEHLKEIFEWVSNRSELEIPHSVRQNLTFVNKEKLEHKQAANFRQWDFALIADQVVIYSDPETLEQHDVTVRGTASWRVQDVDFFRWLFNWIAEHEDKKGAPTRLKNQGH